MLNAAHIIRQSKLFTGLADEIIEGIAARVNLLTYEQGEEIFCEDDDGDSMYVLGSGEVRVLKRMGSGYHEMGRLRAGEHFGEMALISNEHRVATIEAATDVECVRMDRDGYNILMESDPQFAQRILRELTKRLQRTDEAATQDMLRAHHALSFALAKLADSRDPETGAHLYRTREYCVRLSELLQTEPAYEDIITDNFIEYIYLVAPLHDIGKVAIPDGILLKQGKLTDAEFQIMSTHTTLGAEALDTVLEYCDAEVFRMAKRVILCHHERFDGTGYPSGLAGEAIPIEARIMTLADVYDALVSKRVYKSALTYHDTKAMIIEYRGGLFDPYLADVMTANMEDFNTIHQRYQEAQSEAEPDW